MLIEVVATKTVPTIKIVDQNDTFYLHSRYNPLKEAESWVHAYADRIEPTQKILVVGLGAAYHIVKLAERYMTTEIQVVEFNDQLYDWYLRGGIEDQLAKMPYVSIASFSRLSVQQQKELFLHVSQNNILIFEPSLRIMPTEYASVKFFLQDFLLKIKSFRSQSGVMAHNFNYNVQWQHPGIVQWQDYARHRAVLLVSAGPSLKKQLPLLLELRKSTNVVIGAVGTAVIPLHSAAIIPDFVMVSDPNDAIAEQFSNIDFRQTPLFYLSTANYHAIQVYTGPKYIVWQHGYPDAERLAAQRQEPLIYTGGSVATCLLDLIVYMGASTIALVGQDLAYTGGLSHAVGAHAQRTIVDTTITEKVMNYHQDGEVNTSRNLLSYKKWFEHYIKDKPAISFYNCTEGGAYIDGWQHTPLLQFAQRFLYSS